MNRFTRFRTLRVPAAIIAAAAFTLTASPIAFAQGMPFHRRVMRAGFWHGNFNPNKVVTGEPYTAEAVTSTTNTLSDGTRISRRIVATIARDSSGRTMRSQTVKGFHSGAGAGATIVTIFDPVAHERIQYNETTRRARIFVFPSSNSGSPGHNWRHRHPRGSNPNVQRISLGTQTMDGLDVQGTKITRTIPTGQIGNSQPIVTTRETWYSPDLQMVIESSRTDPRFGQTVYTVQNLQRAEPAASLFQVPAGYQTKTIQLHAHDAAGQ